MGFRPFITIFLGMLAVTVPALADPEVDAWLDAGALSGSDAGAKSAPFPAKPNGRKSSNDPTNPITLLHEQILPRLSQVPGGAKLKALIDDYEDVLGTGRYNSVNIGGSNEGISKFIERKRNEDFSLLTDAAKFYGEIAAIDKQRRLLLDKAAFEVPLGYRPSLADRAGDERSKHLYPGWLWDTAMRHAKGDPNRAMLLIGVCGHDDVAQGIPMVDYNDKEKQRQIRAAKTQSLLAEQASLADLIQQAENDPSSLGLNSRRRDRVLPELRNALILAEIGAIASAQNSENGGAPYMCPNRDSALYLPESLGKGVKLPKALEEKITWEQARQDYVKGLRRGESLPGKSYHVYGGALVTCEMIGRGYSPQLVKYLQGWIAWAYRTQRMSVDLKNPFRDGARDLKDPLQKPYPQLSDAEWKAMWEKENEEAKTSKLHFRIKLRNHLRNLRTAFERAKRQPAKAPWAKVDASVGGYQYDRLQDMAKAATEYQTNPLKSPYNPPLSYEEFQKQMRLEHDARLDSASLTALGAGNPFKENQRGAYEEYLYRVKEMEVVWEEVLSQALPQDGPESEFFFGEDRFFPAHSPDLRYGKTGQTYPTVEAFKRAKLSRWHGDPDFQASTMLASTRADAAYLMEQTTLSGGRQIAGKKFTLPYTDFGFPFPNAIRDTPLEHVFSPQPASWDNDRYNRAREMVKTWLVDWDWTVAQHQAGAEFAAKNCRAPKKVTRAASDSAASPEESTSSGSAK